MGGHGGLNILPQKRWNVYNQDNRYRVAEDEEKARQKAAEEKRKKIDAARECRRKLLLERAGGQVDDEGIEFCEKASKETAEFRREVEKEQSESRRRGKKTERTSDAKFDERFKFAYGLQDKKPWYILPRDPAAVRSSQDAGIPDANAKTEASSSKRKHRGEDEKNSHKEKSHKKSSHKKSKKRKAEALLAGLNANTTSASMHMLRKERLQRERREREKARDLLKK
ncbi:hypothetical protein BSKO_04319 [Bryopsis sp. KO-2023]|nr:hypothetical protein BSKO_04319 [Bryopsis sp. KO-2023]